MNYFRSVLYLTLSMLCVSLAVCAVIITRDVHQTAVATQGALGQVAGIEKSTSDMLQATYATEGEIANLADTLNGISADLRTHEDAELKQAQDASAQLTVLFQHADDAVKNMGAVVETTNSTIAGIGADVHATLSAGTNTFAAATGDLTDPALKESLANLSSSTADLKVATKEASGAMSDVHKVTSYEAKQIMAPVSKVKAVALVITRFVGRFFGF